MSYDGMVTHCVVSELNRLLVGGKVDKVYQPEREEIILAIRTPQGNYRLLLSASASNPRVHLTSVARENPMVPPMLCMLMRKHLQGSKILKVSQLGFDRVIRLDMEGRNELGDLCIKSIVVEIMGRHSNVILIDENNKIMDSAKHVDFTVSAVRQILPGLIYENPPSQDKLSPASYSVLDLLRELDNQPEDTLLDKFLVGSFHGMSPLLAREIVYRFTGNTKTTRGEVDTAGFLTHADGILKQICQEQYAPSLLIGTEDKKPFAFSCIQLTQYTGAGIVKTSESMSEVIDSYYELRARREHMNQRANHLIKLVRNNIDRCEKKLTIHQDNLEKAKNRERYKIYGDLVTANLYRVTPGMKELEAENYYSDPLETIKIPLQEDLSPSGNAQRYYKLYTKAKMTEIYAQKQAEVARDELYYLESVLDSLEKAETPAELAEIRDELADGGYVAKTPAKVKKQQKKSSPLSFISSDGFEILVGRNNKQNDELTIRMAYSTDLWFHTKVIPGSHTIIRTQGGKDVPDSTILEAAQIAAYYSKAQNSSKVPVDYTVVKNVKKPNGAKPGMVIYDHYNTLYVDPKCPEISID
ncbi:MAG: NFACT RNA binding domain-containing protein [Clostridia bacterium]|nr:NFACT RNA binding domain-containing protein [Clostridia bacterium]